MNLVEGARLDSGDLAGVMLTRARPYDVPTVTFARSGRRPHRQAPQHSRIRRAAEATLRWVDGRPVPLQVDGDHMSDETVAELSAVPGRPARDQLNSRAIACVSAHRPFPRRR